MPKLIEESVVKSLMDYLVTRPYSEVYLGIPGLMNLPDGILAPAPESKEPENALKPEESKAETTA